MSVSGSFSNLDAVLAEDLAELRSNGLERTLRTAGRRNGAVVETQHGRAVDFSSNDYLGLASDPRLIDAMFRALREHAVGAAAARLITGNNPEHELLEAALARFFGAERALLFSSGYAANAGIIPALVRRGDVIFADALNHASLIDGCRLSRATIHVYPHSDVAALESLLGRHRADARRALIVTDGLFSMDGDLARLGDLVDLAKRFDAWTYVDDAHAVGVLGAGRGSTALAAVQSDVDVTVGTLGKAFGAAGAFVYGSSTLVQYLLNNARSFVFSTAMLPSQAAAAREALAIVETDRPRIERLEANARLMRRMLSEVGVRPLGDPLSPIIPVIIGDAAATVRVGSTLAALGVLVGAVRPPTVPAGTSRLRITISAAHTHEQIVSFADVLGDVLRA